VTAFFEFLAASASPGQVLLALVAGTFGGLVAGLTPGVNGRVGLLLVTPLAITMGPVAGAVFLVAFHSVVHTSGSVPAILLGVPTSATEAATVIDGYAMTRKGESARAIGATLGSSVVGGVIGALLLLALAPVALSAAHYFGAPETAAMSLLGLLAISALSGGSMAGGLMVASLGVVVAAIGLDQFSGQTRFTFGVTALWDGVNAAAVVSGLFVVPELAVRFAPIPRDLRDGAGLRAVLAGFIETLGHRWLLIRTSLLGALVGMAPGMGASVAVWIAYGHARQTEPSAVPYGEGAIAGVIAPEAANNAKEGGALAPALFFGVPSSSGMGILLAAFMVLGVQVGPHMLDTNPGFVYLMGLTNIASNLLAAPICILLAPAMARFASIRGEAVAPMALAAGVAATLMTAPGAETLVMIAVFSMIGLLLKAANLPRAPLLLGFVLAPALESGVVRSMMIHGWSSFTRPGVIVILLVGLSVAAFALLARQRRSEPRPPEATTRWLPVAVGLVCTILLLAILQLVDAPLTARVLPSLAALAGLGAGGLSAWRLWRGRHEPRKAFEGFDLLILGLFGAMLLLAGQIDIAVAAALFAFATLVSRARVGYVAAALAALGLGGLIWLLERIGQ
jgi:putative tricarboxylic transport membrane protein